jgi:hypothetical protein
MPSLTVRLAAASLLFSASVLAQSTDNEMRCDYQRRELCTGKDGCKPQKLAGEYLIVPSRSRLMAVANTKADVEVRLCNAHGCEPAPMRAAVNGAYLELTQAHGGTDYMMIALYSGVLGDFRDEFGMGLVTEIGFGHCPFPKQ